MQRSSLDGDHGGDPITSGATETESYLDGDLLTPERNYDCPHYDTCLALAAALDWRSFTCSGCCGEFDPHLLWRARHAVRKNPALATLCALGKIDQKPSEE